MASTLFSEDKLTAILRAIGGEMLLVNRDGAIQFSESSDSVLAGSLPDAEGAYLWDVFSEETAQKLMQAMSKVFIHNTVQQLVVHPAKEDQVSSRRVRVVRCGEWEVAMLFMADGQTAVNSSSENAESELQYIHKKIENMSGLIPMCSCCKKIRDSEGFWTQLEVYLQRHANTEITHTMCPSCQEEWYK